MTKNFFQECFTWKRLLPPPVLLIMFNRPHKAAEVFERIRQVRPKKFFMVVDGARENHPGEEEKVQQCRAFKDMVDWECDLKVDFAPKNMGCRDRIASGITWAFEHVDELIILEDDCVPDVTFFRFCRELLDKYRDDKRIFSIAATNYDSCESFEDSYAFTKHFHVWGWATWKRAWNCFDITMKQWSDFKQDRYLKNIFRKYNRVEIEHAFQMTYEGKINTWDYIWHMNCLANHALHIVPKTNMMRNIGFDFDSTHVKGVALGHLYMEEAMTFPLVHPKIVSPLDRLFVPPTVPENDLERIEFGKQQERTLAEYDAIFKQLLSLKQYHAIIILFKSILRKRITEGLTTYHLNYIYCTALAYFNLEDFVHAEALINVLLTFDPKNIDLMIFLANVFIRQKSFQKARALTATMNDLNVTNNAQWTQILGLINALEHES